jgi:hypothetical protein
VDSGAGWERGSPAPSYAAPAPHVWDAPDRLAAAATPSSGVPHRRASACTVHPTSASKADARHVLLVTCRTRSTVLTPTVHTAGPPGSGGDPARSSRAWPQVITPACVFNPSNATLSGPICWDHWACRASGSCSRVARLAEHSWGTAWWSGWFPCVIWGGCTPFIPAHSFTVLCPLRASHATRALTSALDRFRGVDIYPLLISSLAY